MVLDLSQIRSWGKVQFNLAFASECLEVGAKQLPFPNHESEITFLLSQTVSTVSHCKREEQESHSCNPTKAMWRRSHESGHVINARVSFVRHDQGMSVFTQWVMIGTLCGGGGLVHDDNNSNNYGVVTHLGRTAQRKHTA